MSYVSLDLLKNAVYADNICCDDALLSFYMDAAEAHVIGMTQRDESSLLEAGDGDLPLELKQAALMLAAHWYRQREAASESSQNAVPYGVSALVKRWRELCHY